MFDLCFVCDLLDQTHDGTTVCSLQRLAADHHDGVGGTGQGLREGVGSSRKLLQHFSTVSQMLKVEH